MDFLLKKIYILGALSSFPASGKERSRLSFLGQGTFSIIRGMDSIDGPGDSTGLLRRDTRLGYSAWLPYFYTQLALVTLPRYRVLKQPHSPVSSISIPFLAGTGF
jgi:hypothetical protein